MTPAPIISGTPRRNTISRTKPTLLPFWPLLMYVLVIFIERAKL